MDSRKRRRIVDDEEDDDSEASNDVVRPIIDVEEDDDDSEDEDDDDDGDYDEDEDDDDEASNDVDDDEVVDKSSNPPGINDSLACTDKGGEKRSGPIVVNVEQGCNPPPPPPPTRAGAGAGAGADLTRPRSSGGARPHPPPRGGRRGADRMLPVSCGVASVHLEEELIHNRISGTRGKKNKGKKSRDTSSSPPHGSLISRNSSSNTVGTYESPPFVPRNVGPETFSKDGTDNEYMCSYCQLEYSACSNDPQNPSLPFHLCEHRFCRDCINYMGGGQDCPVTGCEGKNNENFQLDEELIRRIIVKSCSEDDRQSTNNGVITDDVAGSSPRNQKQSLTSG